MIARHIPMKSVKKSSFSDLVRYITDTQGKQERVQGANITNCHSIDPNVAMLEVEAVQASNTRAQSDKTYHLLISFPRDEVPDKETLAKIEDQMCSALGFSEHQRISATHSDTDNLHLHVAINKIHPKRRTIHDPFQAYKTMGSTCSELEKEFGLSKTNHVAHRSQSEGRAVDMEKHSGIESLVSWVRNECVDDMKAAQSWQELHQTLSQNGLELQKKGNGFVLVAEDGTAVKASTVARDFSKPSLEKRLGEYEESKQGGHRESHKRYEARPLKTGKNIDQLYDRYQKERQANADKRKAAMYQLKVEKARRIEAARRSSQLRRSAIKVMGGSRHTKKLLYAQAHKSLQAEIDAVNARFLRGRQQVQSMTKRLTWADWLREQAQKGDKESLKALRSREQKEARKEEKERKNDQPEPSDSMDGVTKQGTIIYTAGSSSVRDDGERLQVSRDINDEGMQTALSLAAQRYGERLSINGNEEFKELAAQAAASARMSITFSDPELERRRQHLLAIEQEKSHEQRSQATDGRGRRPDSSGHGRAGQRDTDNQRASTRGASGNRAEPENGAAGTRGISTAEPRRSGKPNVGRVGKIPPASSRHRLRALSSLGMVRIAEGSEVLLPGNVPGHLEQQRTPSADTVRRPGDRAGRITDKKPNAAQKYVSEREGKRLEGFDIAKHKEYNANGGTFVYAGTRSVDGQDLALLKKENEIFVLPTDKVTASRLKRLKLGDEVNVSAKQGIRKAKGRSR